MGGEEAARGQRTTRSLDLRFRDAALEAEFWRQQDAATWEQVRIASWMGIGLFGFFGLLADQVITRGFVMDDILRYGVAMPCILLGIVLSYFRQFDGWRSIYLSFSILISAAVSNGALVVTDLPTDWAHSANMLVVGFNFTFIALGFRNALLNALLQTAMYEYALVDRVGWDWLYLTYSNTFFLSVFFVSATAGFMLEKSHRRNFLQARKLDEQRALAEKNRMRSDVLLLNILPAAIADRLRDDPGVIADRFDAVSVLFADLVNFTGQSSGIEPEELVRHLDGIFSRFDEVADAHGLEKIKTIGDAYMAVAGVPNARQDHAEAIARSALRMQEAVRGLTWPSGDPVRLRIGIASGPVVAGVIGTRKFAFDLWGDTVNTASRMESSGEPGRIRVTQRTFELLCDRFRFEGPAELEVKGKGRLNTWFLLGGPDHMR